MVVFDDDALAGGNPGGVNDLSPDTQNATGTLAHSDGADGGSMAWLSTGAPEGFSYVVDGNQLFIEQGETTVMTLTLDAASGAYTVEQNAPLMHPEGLNENNQNFNVSYQVTDGDGDTAAGQLPSRSMTTHPLCRRTRWSSLMMTPWRVVIRVG